MARQAVGSHVLAELREHGHEVTALVRDGDQADVVAARGATPIVADLYDRPAIASVLSNADGARRCRWAGRAVESLIPGLVLVVAADPGLERVAFVTPFRHPVKDRVVAHQELHPASRGRVGLVDGAVLVRENAHRRCF